MDYSNDRIIRARGIETPSSSYTTLVSSDIACAGMLEFTRLVSLSLDKIKKSLVLLHADGLAWDWIGGNVYWTDNCQDDIEVYNPLSGYRSVIVNTGLSQPYAIVVDPTTR